jgi:hypothetical protein
MGMLSFGCQERIIRRQALYPLSYGRVRTRIRNYWPRYASVTARLTLRGGEYTAFP